VMNPNGYKSMWQHFTVHSPRTTPPGSNVPSPALADDGLQIIGNVIWNGPADHPLGLSSLLESDVLSRNQINTVCPALADPLNGDYRVVPGATCAPTTSATTAPARPTSRPSPTTPTRKPTSRPSTRRPTTSSRKPTSRPSTRRPATPTGKPISRPTTRPTTSPSTS
jgi:hypothetical protein